MCGWTGLGVYLRRLAIVDVKSRPHNITCAPTYVFTTPPHPPQLSSVKEKLYTHCGTKPQHQTLVLRHSSGETVRRPFPFFFLVWIACRHAVLRRSFPFVFLV